MDFIQNCIFTCTFENKGQILNKIDKIQINFSILTLI